MPKILTICEGGDSRSVALKHILARKYGHDALACSWRFNTRETIDMLCEWADYIFVMQDKFKEYVSDKYKDKLKIMDVGEDIWYNGLHPELHELIHSKLNENSIL